MKQHDRIQSRSMRFPLFALFAILVFGGAIGLLLLRRNHPPTPLASAPTATATSGFPIGTVAPEATQPFANLPHPLAEVPFPTVAIDYPSGWPAELRYPEGFILVDITSGMLPEDTTKGWGAKLRFRGDPKTAADLLSAFYVSKGWKILERHDLDSGGVTILIARNNQENQGDIVFDSDPDDSDYTRVLAVVFP
jgi:hypothetical protein